MINSLIGVIVNESLKERRDKLCIEALAKNTRAYWDASAQFGPFDQLRRVKWFHNVGFDSGWDAAIAEIKKLEFPEEELRKEIFTYGNRRPDILLGCRHMFDWLKGKLE